MKQIICLIIFVSLITCVSAIPFVQLNKTTNFTTSSGYPIIKLFTNFSLQNVNRSNFWDLLDTPADISITDLGTYDIFVNESGDNMTGNLYGDLGINLSFNTLEINHIAEKTVGHKIVFDNTLKGTLIDMSGVGNRLGGLAVDIDTLVVNPTGYANRVGIKQRYPAEALDVVGNFKLSGDANIGGDVVVTDTSAGAGLADVLRLSGGGTSEGDGASIVFQDWYDGTYPTWKVAEIGGFWDGGLWGGALVFLTNDAGSETDLSEKMKIDRFGNIDFYDGDLTTTGNMGIGIAAETTAHQPLRLANNATHTWFNVEVYSDTTSHYPAVNYKKSHNNNLGTKTKTINNDILGVFNWFGVDSGNNFDLGADIQAVQVGAAGVRVPTSLRFRTANSGGLNPVSIAINESGDTVIIGEVDVSGGIKASGDGMFGGDLNVVGTGNIKTLNSTNLTIQNINSPISTNYTNYYGKLNINQRADSQGILIKGFDDQIGENFQVYIASSGSAYLKATHNYIWEVGGNAMALVDDVTGVGFGIYQDQALSFGTFGERIWFMKNSTLDTFETWTTIGTPDVQLSERNLTTGDEWHIGGFNSTGNITSENVFIKQYVSAHTNNTIAVAGIGNWTNVTFDSEASTPKFGITHTHNDITNDTFTVNADGVYEITYTLSFEDSAASPNAHVVSRVLINEVESNGYTLEEDTTKQNADLVISHQDIVRLSSGDTVKIQFTSDDTTVSLTSHLTYGVHKNTGHITIKKVAN